MIDAPKTIGYRMRLVEKIGRVKAVEPLDYVADSRDAAFNEVMAP